MTTLKVIAGERQESPLHYGFRAATFTTINSNNNNNNIANNEVIQCVDVPQHVSEFPGSRASISGP